MSIDKSKNKMIVKPEVQKTAETSKTIFDHFFSGDDIYFPVSIPAENSDEAYAKWLEIRREIKPKQKEETDESKN